METSKETTVRSQTWDDRGLDDSAGGNGGSEQIWDMFWSYGNEGKRRIKENS